MTEIDWFQSTDPRPLISFLLSNYGRSNIDRKLRMFALACCRELWGTLADEPTRTALALVEHIADGDQRPTQVGVIQLPVGQAVIDCDASDLGPVGWLGPPQGKGAEERFDMDAVPLNLARFLEEAACARNVLWPSDWLVNRFEFAGLPPYRQLDFFRDVVRCPAQPVHFQQAWLRSNGALVRRMAERMYAAEDFADLPILADALEDAGCTSSEILDHCREPRRHVRGCWVVDLLLGKW